VSELSAGQDFGGNPSHTVPPGWYADPAGTPAKRWWSGAGWTEHLQHHEHHAAAQNALAAQAIAQPAAFDPMRDLFGERTTPEPQPQQQFASMVETRHERPLEKPRSTTAHINYAHTGQRYVPLGRTSTGPLAIQRPTRVNTFSAWALALSTIWGASLVGIATLILGSSDLVTYGSIAAYLLVTAAFTLRDHRQLLEDGHYPIASFWWCLLGPAVYLIVRAINVHRNVGRGWALVVTYFSVAAGGLLVAIIVMDILGVMMTGGHAAG
jgi:hypothetical protein